MTFFDERVRAFHEWKCEPLGEVIGKGKYGTVLKSSNCAAKVLDLSGKSRKARMQAYREHVVAMLQTILLLSRVTPHYPFHYGVTTAFGDASMSLTMFMEHFEGSLQDVAAKVFVDCGDWVHLVLQIMHACVCMSSVFGVVHNDLYPRNVLIRMLSKGQRTSLTVEGTSYVFEPRFLAVVTDYGIASGELVGARSVPEVCSSTTKVTRRPLFALQSPDAHILQYEPVLPAFSRDPYTVLKWVFYGQTKLPSAAMSTRLWAMEALCRIDARLADFHDDASQIPLFHHLFHKDNLRRFGLESALLAGASEGSFRCQLSLTEKEEYLRQAAAALRELGEDESKWLAALREFREQPKNTPAPWAHAAN